LPHASANQDHAARFRTTRAAHRDETAEDYVEAVMQLITDRGEARVRDLAAMMGVSHVTVTRIVARLAREGLLEARPYRPVELTAAGRRLADRIRERHRVVLGFLLSLGVPARQAEIDAEGIEHHVSEATIRAMRRAMHAPATARTAPRVKGGPGA
jgi:DtxR family manganese transport transcriptional regulator